MIKGFGILETIIALSLALGILAVVVAHVTDTARVTKKVASNQEKLETIFHAVDSIKSDLNKCGMLLQEAAAAFGLTFFESSRSGFKATFGLSAEDMETEAFAGDERLRLDGNPFFKKNKKVLIYNLDLRLWETNEILETAGSDVILKKKLQHDYARHSVAVALKEVSYQFYSRQGILKRKTDNGTFQPLLEGVSDFFVTFFPDSSAVLYRIEVARKEQIRGYVFLLNLVQP